MVPRSMRRPRKDLGPAGKVLGHLAGTAAGLRPRPGSDPAACTGCRWLSAPPVMGRAPAFWVSSYAPLLLLTREGRRESPKAWQPWVTVQRACWCMLILVGWRRARAVLVIRLDAWEVVRHATTVWTRAQAGAGPATQPVCCGIGDRRGGAGAGAGRLRGVYERRISRGTSSGHDPGFGAGRGGWRGCLASAGLCQRDPPGAAVGGGDQDGIWPWLRSRLRHRRPHRDQRARGRLRHLVPGLPRPARRHRCRPGSRAATRRMTWR